MSKYFLIICLTLFFSNQVIADSSYDRGKEKSVTCSACHGGDGNSENKLYPRLAGQYKNYLIHSLNAYKSGERQNAIMSGFAAGLSEHYAEIKTEEVEQEAELVLRFLVETNSEESDQLLNNFVVHILLIQKNSLP